MVFPAGHTVVVQMNLDRESVGAGDLGSGVGIVWHILEVALMPIEQWDSC